MTLCFRCPSSVVNIGSEFRSVVAAVSVAIAGFWSENQRFRQGSLRSCPNATKSLDKQAHSVLGVVHYSLLQKRSDYTFLTKICFVSLTFPLCFVSITDEAAGKVFQRKRKGNLLKKHILQPKSRNSIEFVRENNGRL